MDDPTQPASAVGGASPVRSEDQAGVSAAIEQGLADIEAGRLVDDSELDDVLRHRVGDIVD